MLRCVYITKCAEELLGDCQCHYFHVTKLSVMVDTGHLQDVKGVFGFHVWPMSPSGTINTKAGNPTHTSTQRTGVFHKQSLARCDSS